MRSDVFIVTDKRLTRSVRYKSPIHNVVVIFVDAAVDYDFLDCLQAPHVYYLRSSSRFDLPIDKKASNPSVQKSVAGQGTTESVTKS